MTSNVLRFNRPLSARELPVPTFYNPANAASWGYSPNLARLMDLADGWRTKHALRAAAADGYRVHLLVIDAQRDFCFPEGTLYVGGRSGRGAIDDNARTADFIYRNVNNLHAITTTLDTHQAFQIFTRSFWLDAQGAHVAPFTAITTADMRDGKVRPNPVVAEQLGVPYAWLTSYAQHYSEQLEKGGKYCLLTWPEHCVLGSDGHALAGIIQEARMFHCYARGAQTNNEVKGGNPLTENYSILRPEVLTRHDGGVIAQKNTKFLETLLRADAVVIAGQAASHCVKSSIDDLLSEIVAKDPALARKVYILADCMSAVVSPAHDYTPEAEAALKRFADAGMHVVQSTDPMESWPGIRL